MINFCDESKRLLDFGMLVLNKDIFVNFIKKEIKLLFTCLLILEVEDIP